MKRVFSMIVALVCVVSVSAQSAYISSSAKPDENRIGDLGGAGGVLVISRHSDLVIYSPNAIDEKSRQPAYSVSPPMKRRDGLYEYEVVVDRTKKKDPSIEVNRRGDVNRVNWVVTLKPDYFLAFLIEEVQSPIRLEDQSKNAQSKQKDVAEIVFQSTISDLRIDASELQRRGATVKQEHKVGDNSIIITTVSIPLSIIDNARQRIDRADQDQEAWLNMLEDGNKHTDAEWDRLEELKAECLAAEEDLAKIANINVYAAGSNSLSADVSNLGPYAKVIYVVVPVKVVEKEHVSMCAGYMDEGGRQFALREYDAARRAFNQALTAKDTPAELISSIKVSIQQCDSCQYWQGLANAAAGKMMKSADNQNAAMRYANSCLEYFTKLNNYNPCDFYDRLIEKVQKTIEEQPLSIKFTAVRWQQDFDGYHEGAPIGNVELWAFYGSNTPNLYDYRDEKRFRKMVGSSLYQQIGTTDAQGEADMQLSRKRLPTGIFFRPLGDKQLQIKYMDMQQIMRQSEGTYNKRQFRLKMFSAMKKK